MHIHPNEILETIEMIRGENLDIRTITVGIDLLDCCRSGAAAFPGLATAKIHGFAGRLVSIAGEMEARYGVPVINKRVAVTPAAILAAAAGIEEPFVIARTLEQAAGEIGIDFIGGFGALVQKGMSPADERLIAAIPRALAETEKVCSSVNVASTKAGINVDALALMGKTLLKAAALTAERDGIACAKLVVFANAPEDNPFMAGAFHGLGEAEAVVNVGISGPGVVRATVERNAGLPLHELAEEIKKTAFKIARMGELFRREAATRLGVADGVIDLSLAPTPAIGDSVAEILEAMGLESCGCPGTTAALAILNNSVKKGGSMGASSVGGLSGAFIPVSEDAGMVAAMERGSLSLEKLEAMTAVCSVGLDMIALPGDTPAATLSAIMADAMAIAVINDKAMGVRLIPVPGKGPGERADWGGLLGSAPVADVCRYSPERFIGRGGRIPAPLRSLGN